MTVCEFLVDFVLIPTELKHFLILYSMSHCKAPLCFIYSCCNAIKQNTIQHNTIQHNSTQHNTTAHNTTHQHSPTQ